MTAEDVKIGQVWERRDGSHFEIENIAHGYAHYWLATGSKPQYRSVRLELLVKNYNLVKWAGSAAEAAAADFGEGE